MVCLVRECRQVGEMLGTNFTVLVMKCGESLSGEGSERSSTGYGQEEDV